MLGTNGYLGRHLTHFLVNQNINVKAYDIQENAIIAGIKYKKFDISDITDIQEIDWNVDVVFIFSGLTGTYNGFDKYNQYMQINECGLLNVLTGIRNSSKHPRIVFPSTRLIYKGSELALTETATKETKTVYAVNKLACENILQAFQYSFDMNYTIYRICVPYGNVLSGEYSYGTVGFFINQAKSKFQICLYGDGLLRRTFTHVEDICNQIINTCNRKISKNETYNTIGESYSLKDIAQLIAEKYKVNIKFIPWPEMDLRIESGSTVFNSKKIESTFNLQLKHRFTDWLKTF